MSHPEKAQGFSLGKVVKPVWLANMSIHIYIYKIIKPAFQLHITIKIYNNKGTSAMLLLYGVLFIEFNSFKL